MAEWVTLNEASQIAQKAYSDMRKYARDGIIESKKVPGRTRYGYNVLVLRADAERMRSVPKGNRGRWARHRTKEFASTVHSINAGDRTIPEHLIPAFREFVSDVAREWARKKEESQHAG